MGGALTRRVSGIDLSGNAVRMKGVRGTGPLIEDFGFWIKSAESMEHRARRQETEFNTIHFKVEPTSGIEPLTC